jgi:hypothetical protein
MLMGMRIINDELLIMGGGSKMLMYSLRHAQCLNMPMGMRIINDE